MRRYTLEEFFSDPEFEELITNSERKYYDKNGTFKHASEFIEKLAGQYFDVDTKYKGKNRILIIGEKNPNAPHLDGRKNNNVREVNKRIQENFICYLQKEVEVGRIKEGDSRTPQNWLFTENVLGEEPHIYNTFKSRTTNEFKESSKIIENYFRDQSGDSFNLDIKKKYSERRIPYDQYQSPHIREVVLNPLTQQYLIGEYMSFISKIFTSVTKKMKFIEFEKIKKLKYETKSILVSKIDNLDVFFKKESQTFEISLYGEIVSLERAKNLILSKSKEDLKEVRFILKPKKETVIVSGNKLKRFEEERIKKGIKGINYYKSKKYKELSMEVFNTKKSFSEYRIKSINKDMFMKVTNQSFDVYEVRELLIEKFENSVITKELNQEYYPILRENTLYKFKVVDEKQKEVEDILYSAIYGIDDIEYKVKKDRVFYFGVYSIVKILSGTKMNIVKYLEKRDEKIKNDILSNDEELNIELFRNLEEPFASKFKSIYFDVYPEVNKRIKEYERLESMLTTIDSDREFEDRLSQLNQEFKDVINYL